MYSPTKPSNAKAVARKRSAGPARQSQLVRPQSLVKPKTGDRIDVWFASPGEWEAGIVTAVEGPQFYVSLPGVGQLGPFHHAKDRFRLWRPRKHPAEKGGADDCLHNQMTSAITSGRRAPTAAVASA